MTAIDTSVTFGRRSWNRVRRAPLSVLVPLAVIGAMLGVWLLLALLYAGIGGGRSVADAQRVIAAVTSSRATAGDLEVQAILATPEYFEVTDRSDQYFKLDPDANLSAITRDPRAFDALDQSAEALAVDPAQMLPILLVVNAHEGSVPDPAAWLPGVTLSADGVAVPPIAAYRVAFQTDHHLTVAVQFPRQDPQGRRIDTDRAGQLRLEVPDALSSGSLDVEWALPLATGSVTIDQGLAGSAATLASILAVLAGLLVVFSPCAVHMTAYFLPIITGISFQELSERQTDVRFRGHVALSGLAFVAGFVVLYTAFGVAAGFAGQFFANTAQLEPYLVPFRIVTGAVVIYLAIQTLGFFRMPFIIALRLPGRPHRVESPRQGYLAAVIAGMSISLGCLVCVGGTLLASLLIYAGTSRSPLVGGLTLFLFSVGMSLPFLLASLAFDKILPRFRAMRAVLQYSTSVAGAVMLVLGLLIISGNDSLFERLVL